MVHFLKTGLMPVGLVLFIPHFTYPKYMLLALSTLGTQCSNVKIPAEFRLCGSEEKHSHSKATQKLKGLAISTCGDLCPKTLIYSLLFTKFLNAHE